MFNLKMYNVLIRLHSLRAKTLSVLMYIAIAWVMDTRFVFLITYNSWRKMIPPYFVILYCKGLPLWPSRSRALVIKSWLEHAHYSTRGTAAFSIGWARTPQFLIWTWQKCNDIRHKVEDLELPYKLLDFRIRVGEISSLTFQFSINVVLKVTTNTQKKLVWYNENLINFVNSISKNCKSQPVVTKYLHGSFMISQRLFTTSLSSLTSCYSRFSMGFQLQPKKCTVSPRNLHPTPRIKKSMPCPWIPLLACGIKPDFSGFVICFIHVSW